eukprot:518978-Pyramimonas_sp.AAC.1
MATRIHETQGFPSADQLGINLEAWTTVIGQLDGNVKAHLGVVRQQAANAIGAPTADVYTAATSMASILLQPGSENTAKGQSKGRGR